MKVKQGESEIPLFFKINLSTTISMKRSRNGEGLPHGLAESSLWRWLFMGVSLKITKWRSIPRFAFIPKIGVSVLFSV